MAARPPATAIKKPHLILEHVAEMKALDGIRRGLADVEAGRVTPLKQFESEFRAQTTRLTKSLSLTPHSNPLELF